MLASWYDRNATCRTLTSIPLSFGRSQSNCVKWKYQAKKSRLLCCAHGQKQSKTYDSGNSPVVTHLTTDPPVKDLTYGDPTRASAALCRWSYVKEIARLKFIKCCGRFVDRLVDATACVQLCGGFALAIMQEYTAICIVSKKMIVGGMCVCDVIRM